MTDTSMSKLCADTPVVILAGGKGTRLQPYTTVLPKPLMPVGQYPILEILLRQLSEQGFRDVTLAVGHLAGIIQAYFKEGRDWGLDICLLLRSNAPRHSRSHCEARSNRSQHSGAQWRPSNYRQFRLHRSTPL